MKTEAAGAVKQRKMKPFSGGIAVTNMISQYTFIIVGLGLAVLLSGCASRIGISRVGLREQFKRMNRNSLIAKMPSERTMLYLNQYGLKKAWEDNSLALLKQLDAELRTQPTRDLLFVLIELSYLEAEKRKLQSPEAAKLYLSCAAYSYAYLFNEQLGPLPSVFHPHSRLACEFYNRSLAAVLINYRDNKRRFRGANSLPLLEGRMKLEDTKSELIWDPQKFSTFYVAYEYEVKGLDEHYASYGLGVPVIAVRPATNTVDEGENEKYLPKITQTYPVTIFLRLSRPLVTETNTDIRCVGTLELYNPIRTSRITVGTETVPLEADYTKPLACMVQMTPNPGGFKGMLDVDSWRDKQGLYMLQPYDPDKIPLVFIHGLMSSPRTWLPMLNSLFGDPRIRDHYQFWFFMYPTGNPVMYSAANLREALLEIQETYDPYHTNPAFNRMVLVSHSMGGLLTKFMVQPSGTSFWSLISPEPIEDLQLDPEKKEFLTSIFFFDSLPFVKRVVFISTPHRGATLADSFIGRLGARTIRLPGDLVSDLSDTIQEIATNETEEERVTKLMTARLPTGIDSLSPENPTLTVSVDIPISSNVTYHSIIGNRRKADTPGGTDGVVPYWSSHLDGAASEKIVKSGHDAQTKPLAIEEVRRILHLHLDQEK